MVRNRQKQYVACEIEHNQMQRPNIKIPILTVILLIFGITSSLIFILQQLTQNNSQTTLLNPNKAPQNSIIATQSKQINPEQQNKQMLNTNQNQISLQLQKLEEQNVNTYYVQEHQNIQQRVEEMEGGSEMEGGGEMEGESEMEGGGSENYTKIIEWPTTKPQSYQIYTKNLKELPLCLIPLSNIHPSIEQQLQKQNYSNYKLLQPLKRFQIQSSTINLTSLNQHINSLCLLNSLIIFLPKSPQTWLFSYLNKIYQTKQVWASFAYSEDSLQLIAVYQRLLILVENNNFTGNVVNNPTIKTTDLILDIFQLAKDNLDELPNDLLPKQSQQGYLKTSSKIGQDRPKYDSLLSMKQFSKINKTLDNNNFQKMMKNQEDNYRAEKWMMTQKQMVDAILYKELLYLPKNHSLADKQRSFYQKKYHLQAYNAQKPLCVFIPSHNNIQDNRYQRVIHSIFQQEYTNYHIVFIDDYSNDQTLRKTIHLVKKAGFTRVSYVQNLRKNYATYNIVNAAFNYCGAEDIMVLLDGDDELIGRQVFRLLNYAYQYKPNWLVWTTFISNLYTYGHSIAAPTVNSYINLSSNKRRSTHWVGHLTTFYSALFRMIKLEDHQCISGYWLDTLYDLAIEHPLLEMATPQHSQFVCEATYLYNREYGNNDDSAYWKRQYRKSLYWKQIHERPIYKPLKQLSFEQETNSLVYEQLKKDLNVRYHNIQKEDDIVQITEQVEMDPENSCRKYINNKK